MKASSMSSYQHALLLSVCVLLSTESIRNVSAEVTKLNVENFEELTKGKNVFIKFFAPWCGHCRAMAEDFEKLAADWENHPVGLIAEIDCTSDLGQPICEDFEVQGFPTLVYGDPMTAETYEGSRDYISMSEFTKEHISTPICSVFHLENCNDDDTALIESLKSKSATELKAIVDQAEAEVKVQEEKFDVEVATIQEKYDALVSQFNNDLDVIKEKYNYKYVEQVMSIRGVEFQDDDSGKTFDSDEL